MNLKEELAALKRIATFHQEKKAKTPPEQPVGLIHGAYIFGFIGQMSYHYLADDYRYAKYWASYFEKLNPNGAKIIFRNEIPLDFLYQRKEGSNISLFGVYDLDRTIYNISGAQYKSLPGHWANHLLKYVLDSLQEKGNYFYK